MTNHEAPLTVMRWKRGEPRLSHVMNPLDEHRPLAAAPCICGTVLADGTSVQLLAAGPHMDNEHDQRAHRAGTWYNAAAFVLHERCVDPLIIADLDLQDDFALAEVDGMSVVFARTGRASALAPNVGPVGKDYARYRDADTAR